MDKYTQWRIQEMKEQKMIQQHGVCAGCNKEFRIGEVRELAHILPKRKDLIETYGDEVINHPLNMVLTHTGYSNSDCQMSPNKTALVEKHIESIRDYIQENQ